MPRKGPAPRRELDARPDLQVGAGHPARQQGDAARQAYVAEKIVYDALRSSREVRGRADRHPQAGDRQHQAAARSASRRVGGATYQVPVEVKARRAN